MAIVIQKAPNAPASFGTITGDKLGYTPTGGWAMVGVISSKALPTTGKVYYEVLAANSQSQSFFIGVANSSVSVESSGGVSGGVSGGASMYPAVNMVNATMGICVDTAAKTVALYVNNAYYGSVNYTLSGDVYPWLCAYSGSQYTFNFGRSAFKYKAPTGYVPFDEAPKCLIKTVSGSYSSFDGTQFLDIGPSEDYTLGFYSYVVQSINQSQWSSVAGAKLLINCPSDVTSVNSTLYPPEQGSLVTTDITSIDLKGYAGINKVTINGVGGRYALSFDKGVTWKSRRTRYSGYSGSTVVPNMTGVSSTAGCTISGSANYGGAGWGLSNAFDGNPSTYYISNAGTPVEIRIDFVTARAIGGYALTGYGSDGIPVDWTLNGLKTDGTWEPIDTKAGIDTITTCTTATDTVGVYNSYKFVFTKSSTSNKIGISEIALFDAVAIREWVDVQVADIPTQGITLSTLNALNASDYALVFKRTQLYIYASITPSDSISGIVVDLPTNLGPAISNFKASTSTTHKSDIILTADIADLEEDSLKYRLKIDGVVYQDWSTLMPSPLPISVTVPYSAFTANSTYTAHQVDLEAMDSRGVSTTAVPIIVGRVNTLPTFTVLSVNSRLVRATIGDVDNDKVKYRVLINDVEVKPWSDFMQAPHSLEYYVDKSMLIWTPYPAQNKITIEYKDDLNQGGKEDMFFLASYTGLVFTDETDVILNDDRGNILVRPNLGTSTAGTHGSITTLKLKNLTGLPVRNVKVSVDQSSVPLNTHIKLSSSDTAFEDLDTLSSVSLLNDGDSMTFYAQPSSESSAAASGNIKIVATGQLV